VCDSREKGDHHAERHAAGTANQGAGFLECPPRHCCKWCTYIFCEIFRWKLVHMHCQIFSRGRGLSGDFHILDCLHSCFLRVVVMYFE